MSDAPSLQDYLDGEKQAIADACTACGRCFEVCPVVPYAALDDPAPGAIARSVRDLLAEGAPLSGDAAEWLARCNGCGACIPACPEGVNPRRMLSLAQQAASASGGGVPEVFRKMAQSVRLMAAMQLVPEDMARLLPRRKRAGGGAPEVIFYLGCNALRTPHVLLDAMTVLDALDVDYEVAGGPSACCGIVHTRTEGEIDAGGRVANHTLVRFNASGAKRVLSWCPSCQLQLGETVRGFREMRFELEHVTAFLLEHRARLEASWSTPVERRVILHAHDGYGEFGRSVASLLDTIPGLDRAETVIESGYTCGAAGSDRAPGRKAADRERLYERVRETGADTVVSLYHGCHRSLVQDGAREGFDTVNFTALLVEALGGTPHPDGFRTMYECADSDAVAEEAQRYLAANGMNVDAAWLGRNLTEMMTMAEYRGGLGCLGSRHPD